MRLDWDFKTISLSNCSFYQNTLHLLWCFPWSFSEYWYLKLLLSFYLSFFLFIFIFVLSDYLPLSSPWYNRKRVLFFFFIWQKLNLDSNIPLAILTLGNWSVSEHLSPQMWCGQHVLCPSQGSFEFTWCQQNFVLNFKKEWSQSWWVGVLAAFIELD